MTRTALFVMLILVALAAAGAFFLRDDSVARGPRVSPLARVDFESIKKLTCATDAFGSWSVETKGLNRFFRAKGIAGGNPVAVDENMYGRIMGFLQDARPTGDRALEDVDLKEWGLEPPIIRLSLEDASGIHEFEIGSPDLNEDLLIREKGGDRLFSFPARVVADLSRDPKWFRDPRLCDIPGHLAERFDFKRADGDDFSLVRAATQWFVEPANGERRRALTSLVDQVTVALAGARGTPVESDQNDKPAMIEIAIVGMGRTAKFDIVSLDRKNLLARRADEPDLRRLDGGLLRFIDLKAADLEDPALIGIDANEVGEINILHPSGRPLRLERRNRFWSLKFGTSLSWSVDAIAMKEFQTELLRLKTLSRHPKTEERRAQFTVEIGFDADLELPPVVVSFSEPDSQGNRFAWRSDENSEYVVGPAASKILQTRYWDLMARYVCVGVAAKIDNIEITDTHGVVWHLKRSMKAGNWELTDKRKDGVQVQGFKIIEFPEDPMTGLLNLLSQLSVKGFLGEQTPEMIAKHFAQPLYEVHWTYKELVPTAGADEWAPRRLNEKFFQIGERLDDVLLRGRVSEFPALEFKMPGIGLLPITDILRNLK